MTQLREQRVIRRQIGCHRRLAALKAVGADVRYTEFPDANHNAWDPAYATPELWTWLFGKRH